MFETYVCCEFSYYAWGGLEWWWDLTLSWKRHTKNLESLWLLGPFSLCSYAGHEGTILWPRIKEDVVHTLGKAFPVLWKKQATAQCISNASNWAGSGGPSETRYSLLHIQPGTTVNDLLGVREWHIHGWTKDPRYCICISVYIIYSIQK